MAAKNLTESSAEDVGWTSMTIPQIKEQFEGAESNEFWEGMKEGDALNPPSAAVTSLYNETLTHSLALVGSQSKHFKHFSLLNDSNSYDWTPRLWRLEAKHDSFEANEITSPYRLTTTSNPLPFTQEDLYASNIQPGNLIFTEIMIMI